METKASKFFLSIVLVAFCLGGFGCAHLGPPGAKGAAAVVSGPVQSSNGPLRVKNSDGDTFCIVCRDEAGLGLDMYLKNDLSNALRARGMQESSDPDGAYYIFDIVTRNFMVGKGPGPGGGTAAGAVGGMAAGAALATTGALDSPEAAAVGLGLMLLGAAIDAANTPSFCALECDVVIDEINPFAKKGQDPYMRHETVFSGAVKFMGHQASERDAVDVLQGNFAREIANAFR